MIASIWQRKDSIREGVLGRWFINRDLKNGCDSIKKKVYSKVQKDRSRRHGSSKTWIIRKKVNKCFERPLTKNFDNRKHSL